MKNNMYGYFRTRSGYLNSFKPICNTQKGIFKQNWKKSNKNLFWKNLPLNFGDFLGYDKISKKGDFRLMRF